MYKRQVLGTTQIPYGEYVLDLGKPFERITMLDAVKKYAGVDFNEIHSDEEAKAVAREYVTKIDFASNRVVLGPEGSQYAPGLVAEKVNWIALNSPKSPFRADVKVRYKASPAPATVFPLEDGRVRVEFDTPQRSVTPGQAAVFYQGELVAGGGTIVSSLP